MNVLILCSDTFRFDHLGFLGRQKVLTPNLDELARESAVFADYRLCSFPTILNRMDAFTGRYTFPVTGWGRLPFQFPVLSEVFKHHGFATALIADNPHLMKPGNGFARGFDYARHVPGQNDERFQPPSAPMLDLACPIEKLEPRPRRLERYRRNAFYYRQLGISTTEIVCQETSLWLQQAPERFFLWVDFFNPHEPWDAPRHYLENYPWDQAGEHVLWPRDGSAGIYPSADIANMRSLYRAEVTQVDECIGRIVERLKQSRLLEKTVVIFCSDHGYYFGEHGFVGKLFKRETGPNKLYDEVGHIPLLVRHPHGLAAGQSIQGFCQPPDLFPTALEFAGIPRVPWAQGNSLVGRLAGASSGQDFAVGGLHPHPRNAACVTFWDQEWSLIYSPLKGIEGSELYHRATDPQQLKNVLGENVPVVERHLQTIRSWLAGLGLSQRQQRQLLHYEALDWTRKVRQRFWLLKNRAAYLWRFRNYAQPQAFAESTEPHWAGA